MDASMKLWDNKIKQRVSSCGCASFFLTLICCILLKLAQICNAGQLFGREHRRFRCINDAHKKRRTGRPRQWSIEGWTFWLTYMEDKFQLSKGRLNLCLNLHSVEHLTTTTDTPTLFSPKYTIITRGGICSSEPWSFHITVVCERRQSIPSGKWNNDQAIQGMKKRGRLHLKQEG